MSTQAIVVPQIDLANFPQELEKLAAAATDLGFFRIVNHGIPATLLAEITAVARWLSGIPVEAKQLNVEDRIYNGGYVQPKGQGTFMESFGIYDAASKEDVHSFCSVMEVSPSQREIISEYVANLHGLSMKLASKVAESLGLVGCSFQQWTCDARMHHYNFTLQEEIGSIAVHGHTDTGFLTILQEDECVGGLEIMNANGNFVAIDPIPGTFLVAIGDMGKAWSNGRLNNAMHRVVCKEARPRISIIFFLLAPKDDLIEPEPVFVDSDHPRLYQIFKYTEYRRAKNSAASSADKILPRLKEQHMKLLKGEYETTISSICK